MNDEAPSYVAVADSNIDLQIGYTVWSAHIRVLVGGFLVSVFRKGTSEQKDDARWSEAALKK